MEWSIKSDQWINIPKVFPKTGKFQMINSDVIFGLKNL